MEDFSFNEIITTTKTTLDYGAVQIITAVLVLMSMLAVIDFVLTTFNNIGSAESVIKALIKRFLKYAFFFYVTKDFLNISKLLFDFFTNMGLIFIDDNILPSGTFSLDSMTAILLESVKTVAGIIQGGGFKNDIWLLFYLITLFIAFFLIISLVVAIAVKIIQFYIVSTVSLVLFAFNLFEPLADIGEKAIRAIVNSGMQLTLTIALAGITVQVMNSKVQQFNLDKINSNNNDILALVLFIMLLAIMALLVGQVDNISMLISSGQGAGFSLAHAGSQVTRGIGNTANAVINTVAIAAAGTGLLKAGAETAGKETLKQTAEKAGEGGLKAVEQNSSMQALKSSYDKHHMAEKPNVESKGGYDKHHSIEKSDIENRPNLDTIEKQKKSYQNETSFEKHHTPEKINAENKSSSHEQHHTPERPNQDLNQNDTPKAEKESVKTDIKEQSRLQEAKERYDNIKQGTFGNITRAGTNTLNKGVSTVTGGEANEIHENKKNNDKKGE